VVIFKARGASRRPAGSGIVVRIVLGGTKSVIGDVLAISLLIVKQLPSMT
jgi:hypothetical protein